MFICKHIGSEVHCSDRQEFSGSAAELLMSNLLNPFQIGGVPESVDLYITASQPTRMFYSQNRKTEESDDAISSDTPGEQLSLKNSVIKCHQTTVPTYRIRSP